jgi:hypothetical protein
MLARFVRLRGFSLHGRAHLNTHGLIFGAALEVVESALPV